MRHHRLSAADSLYRVLDNPLSSLLTWMVIGIALALPVGLNVALDNVGQVSANWDSPSQISLFLQDGLGTGKAEQLQAELALREDIASTEFVSREAALEEFSALSGFADILASLAENPLPNLILVTPAAGLEGKTVAALREELQGHPGVAEALLDMEWLQRLNNLMELSRRLVFVVGGMLVARRPVDPGQHHSARY